MPSPSLCAGGTDALCGGFSATRPAPALRALPGRAIVSVMHVLGYAAGEQAATARFEPTAVDPSQGPCRAAERGLGAPCPASLSGEPISRMGDGSLCM